MSFALVGVAIVTVLFIFHWRRSGRKTNGFKTLPGPKGLPLIGNIHQLGNYPHQQYSKWCEKYGSLFKVRLAGVDVVIVSDPKLSKELYSDPASSGKPAYRVLKIHEGEANLGIFGSESEPWEIHRRFLLRHLRDFGFGKSAMESLIMDEVNEILDTLKGQEGSPVDGFKNSLTLAVVNSLWRIVSNERFSQDDPQLRRLTMLTIDAFNDVQRKGGMLVFVPWLRYVIPEMSGYKAIRGVVEENKLNFEETVKEHKANLQMDDLKDYIDVFLAEIKKTSDPKSPFFGDKAERFLVEELFDLFIAGSDSTASTIYWLIYYLCKDPQIQEKLQKEITEVTGDCRKVSILDRSNMPFTQALMDEVLRASSLVPDGVQHRIMEDREFHGYFIPKNTWIQPNLHYMHYDPKIWGDPQNFRPERFLSSDGSKYIKSDNVQAFMVGKRQCVGEQLARDTVFLYSTNLFQQFTMEFDPSSPEPVEDVEPGFFRVPYPFKILMKDRLSK